ncbi:MAG: helix-turn-helix domain-containing protein [Elusimicrobia bacterium]|nr:helix-turn-helix domain-containing protein [Elusimicrobiota bacterium]
MNKNTIRYNSKKEKLFKLVKSLSKNRPCFATTEYLAKTIGMSKRQVYRYLKDLRSSQKLFSYSERYREQDKYGKVRFYEKRIISNNRNQIPIKKDPLDRIIKRENNYKYIPFQEKRKDILFNIFYGRKFTWNIEKLNL